jgi:hypothetical protein
MGSTIPPQPVHLKGGDTVDGIGSSKVRLRWDTISVHIDPDSKLWIYEQGNSGNLDFIPTLTVLQN